MKVNGSKFIIFVLYVDDILLAPNNFGLLHDIKNLSKNSEMKNMGEASYVIEIEIFCDRSQGLLGLSQRTYIEKILERFRMERCSIGIIPIHKEEKFSEMQCLKSDLKWKTMKYIPSA